MKEEMLAPRSNPSILPFNTSKIAILGGLKQKKEAYMGDVLFFDVRTKLCTTLIPDLADKEGRTKQVKFSSAANQSALVGQDWLVSLVNSSDNEAQTKTTCPALIGYKRGAESV